MKNKNIILISILCLLIIIGLIVSIFYVNINKKEVNEITPEERYKEIRESI